MTTQRNCMFMIQIKTFLYSLYFKQTYIVENVKSCFLVDLSALLEKPYNFVLLVQNNIGMIVK